MKNLKQVFMKTTAILMIAVLLIGFAPIGSLADVEWSEFGLTFKTEALTYGDYTYTVENGEATITRYNGAGGEVVIPETLGEYSVVSIGDSAFSGCGSLTSLQMPDSIISIGYWAFFGCGNLKIIDFSNSVISIGARAFAGCANLASVDVPNSVTNIGVYVFVDCVNLASIKISDSVTSIGDYAFYNTAYYNDESNWDDGVLYIGNHLIDTDKAISGNYAVKNGTKTIAYNAFMDCNKLVCIEIPNSITNIGNSAFYGCKGLISIVVPNSITDIGDYAFWDCENLEDVYYSGSKYDWNCMVIGEYGNDDLLNATIHFAKEPHTHTYTANTTTPATCAKTGIKTYSCSCGDSYTEAIKATGKHTGGTATCKAKAKCAVCGAEYGSLAKHKETTIAGKAATYTATGLTAGKKCSVCGTVTVNQTTIPKLTLGKVSGLKAKDIKVAKSSEIKLTWNKVDGAEKYEVYQYVSKKWKKIKTTTGTSYTVKKLKADKSYKFKVRAVVEGASGAYSTVFTVETIPETTSKLTIKAGKKQLTASWKSVSGILGYEVQYSTSKKFTKKTTKTVNVKKSAKKTTIKKLTKGKKYYVRVRTYKTVNGKKVYSNWSTVKNVKVK